jgi:predicted DNA-binding transcriptional regulator AlpA
MSDDVLVRDPPAKLKGSRPVPAARKAPLLASTAPYAPPKPKAKPRNDKQPPPRISDDDERKKRPKDDVKREQPRGFQARSTAPPAEKRVPMRKAEAARREDRSSAPRKHHLDRRAAALITHGEGDPNDLLKTKQVAAWLSVSDEFLEIGRSEGYGPNFVRLGPSSVRYVRSDVLKWLAERTYASTCEYAEPSKRGRRAR